MIRSVLLNRTRLIANIANIANRKIPISEVRFISSAKRKNVSNTKSTSVIKKNPLLKPQKSSAAAARQPAATTDADAAVQRLSPSPASPTLSANKDTKDTSQAHDYRRLSPRDHVLQRPGYKPLVSDTCSCVFNYILVRCCNTTAC